MFSVLSMFLKLSKVPPWVCCIGGGRNFHRYWLVYIIICLNEALLAIDFYRLLGVTLGKWRRDRPIQWHYSTQGMHAYLGVRRCSHLGGRRFFKQQKCAFLLLLVDTKLLARPVQIAHRANLLNSKPYA